MKKVFILYMLLMGVYFPGLQAHPDIQDGSRTQPLPLCFIENKGQVRTPADEQVPQLKYIVRVPGMTVFISNNSLHYTFAKPDKDLRAMGSKDTTPVHYRLQQMELVLEGANKAAIVQAEEQQAYYENYYGPGYGAEGITDVHSYGRLVVKDVYPHIDWVLYVSNGRLKYDFVVKEGGRATDIRLRYKGADKITLNPDGSVTAVSPLGNITEDAPVAFAAESKKELPCAFVLEGDLLRFDLKGYNSPVVIDPTLSWATYYGGNDFDYVYSLVSDGAGDLYMSGVTASTNNIATPGSFMSTYAASTGQDATGFIVKFSGGGVRQWATYYRGVAYVYSQLCMAVDRDNNVYLGGETETPGMSTTGSFQATLIGNRDGFLAKFSSGGVRQWATYYGGGGSDGIHAVACDAANNVYVTGKTGSNGMATAGAHQVVSGGGWDGFLTKFDATGQRQWSTYYGGSSNNTLEEMGTSLVCDGPFIYMVGQTASANGIATPLSQQPVYGGDLYDHFLVKFDDNGVRQWGTYVGGSGQELNEPKIAKDALGDIYMTGDTRSFNNIATPGSHQPAIGGGLDMYVMKFNYTGMRLWGTYFGGTGAEWARTIVCDHSDAVYVGGFTSFHNNTPGSSGLVYPACNYQDTVPDPDYTSLLIKFNASGTRLWSTYYGGPSAGCGGLAVNPQNELYMAGSTPMSTGFPTPGTHQPVYGGGAYDGFLVKFIRPTLRITSSMSMAYCPGATFTLQYTTDLPFASGNVFTAQLSDANGNWTNPVNIGNTTSSASGSIACTLPVNIPPGSGYRVRLVASSPAGISPVACPAFTIHPVILPVLAATGPTTVCAGDTVWLTASGATSGSYVWYRNGTVIPGVTGSTYPATVPGNYTVSIFNGTCAGISNVVTVAVNQLPVASIYPANDTSICSGSALTFTAPAGAGYTYVWLRNGIVIPGATGATYAAALAGSYRVAIHALPCPSDTSLAVNLLLKPTPPAPAVTPVYHYCPGDIATPLQATGQNLLWYPGSLSAAPQTTVPVPSTTTPGIFVWYVTQTGTNGCESPAATITVHVHARPLPPVVTDLFLCTDDVPQPLTANGQGLLWYAGATGGTGSVTAPLPNTAVAGIVTYYVSQTVNGCESDRAAIVVDVAQKAIASFTVSRDTVCQGDTVTLLAAGPNAAGAVYNWATGKADIISGGGPGPVVIRTRDTGVRELKLQVTNAQCAATEIHEIYVRPAREFIFYLPADVCPGDTVNLNFDHDPSWQYTWDFDDAIVIDSSGYNRYLLSWNTPGIKAVTMQVSRLHACPALLEPRYVDVHEPPPAKVAYTSSTDICSGDQVMLRADYNDKFTYKWTPQRFFTGDDSWETVGTIRATGAIVLTVTNQWGCHSYDSVYINARPCCDIFLPDAFTPNGDGLNDLFHIITPGHHQLSAFRVVNRWGEVVFRTLDQNAGWDGRYKGVPQDAGTYFYQIKYRCDDGRVYEKKGDVILVR